MTTKIRDTNRFARRTLLTVTSLTAGALLLAGCVTTPTDDPTPSSTPSATASPTPSPTPTEATAPTSDSEAVAAAEEVISRFYEVRGEVNAAGGSDVEPLTQVATENALAVATQDAERIAVDGKTTSGALAFTSNEAYSSDLTDSAGTVYPFSAVSVTGCQDGSNYSIRLADGTEPQRPDPRAEIQITVIFDPAISTWLVQDLRATGAAC